MTIQQAEEDNNIIYSTTHARPLTEEAPSNTGSTTQTRLPTEVPRMTERTLTTQATAGGGHKPPRVSSGTTNARNGTIIPTTTNNVIRKTGQKQIKICGLNVCGLNSKINLGVFNDYIKTIDIMCVSESKVAKGNNISEFKTFELENESKKYPLPGIHGLHVYIADHLAGQCSQISIINPFCEAVIWINIDKQFILGAMYAPHENSKHYEPSFYNELSEDIANIKGTYGLPIMIVGDLNSRTGVLNDLLIPDKNEITDESDSKFLDIINIFNSLNVPLNRTNMDTKVNNNGRSLIEMCNVHDLCIVNGRFGSDKNIGNTTCADVSTIDYVICTPDLFPKITDFTIDTFCDSLSDIHKPIIVNVNITRNQMHANNPIQSNSINTKELM